MDIKSQLAEEDKQTLAILGTQYQVLNDLLRQQKQFLELKAQEVLAKLGLSPKMYNVQFNPSQDKWEAVLKEGALVLPNRQARRVAQRRGNHG